MLHSTRTPAWVREDTDKVREVKAQFQEWAIANSYLHRLMAGQMDVLTEYVEFIAARENEILPALMKIMQAANRYQFNVDGIIERFQDQLDFKELRSRIGIINSRVTQMNIQTFSVRWPPITLMHNDMSRLFIIR